MDFIHYSIEDESIRAFIEKLNCIPEIKLEIVGSIEELKHQDYHGKSIKVRITDNEGTSVESKIDIGVHKHLELEQEEYCFDVCASGLIDFYSQYGHPISREPHQLHSFIRRSILFDDFL